MLGSSPSMTRGKGPVSSGRRGAVVGKDVADEIVRYAADPAPDAVLIMTHAGGAKGKALLTSLKKASRTVTMTEYPKITRFSDRLDFVRGVDGGSNTGIGFDHYTAARLARLSLWLESPRTGTLRLPAADRDQRPVAER